MGMTMYEMAQVMGADMPARYSKDSVRISAGEYHALMDRAHQLGRVFNIWTRGRQLPGGRIRRTNGATIEV